MKSFLLGSIAISIFVISFVGESNAKYSSEIDAKLFIKDASERIYNSYNKIANSIYNSNNDEDDFENLFSKITNVKIIAKELVEISKEAQFYDLNKFHDNELKLALRNLRKVCDLFVLDEEYFSSVLLNVGSLMELATDKDVEPYQNGIYKTNSDIAYYPDIEKVFAESKNPEEMKYYWETWRERNRQWAALNFYSIVESIRKAAKILDLPVLEFWYKYYDEDFLMEMENVMKQLKPIYMELHGFIRFELIKKYGNEIFNSNGPIPDHLFQQVLIQTWKNDSILNNLFPSPPPYDKFIQEKHFNAKNLLEIAENFYKSLGFQSMNESFWKNHVKIHSDDDIKGDCRADIFDITPNIYIKYCNEVDFRRFMQSHGHISRIYYAKIKENLPAYFFNSYDLEYSLGEATILSASTPKHLTEIGLIVDYKFTNEVLMNRLMRMGIHTLLNIPVFFVHTKIMNDLLNDTIDMEGINKHYWMLMEEYVGVEPPLDRPENSLDFPHKFYTDLDENHQARKFVSEILGYQFYQALCKKSGHVGEVHNCDFYNNKDAGNALKEMMALGSSKPWRHVISKLLPENPALSANGLLEYYAPVRNWLQKKNKESNYKIGWDVSKKKVL